MKTLRSLCLLKVSTEQGLNYEDLPPALVKDLNLMKAFNGNFEYELDWGDDEYHTTLLTILYDGVSWVFTSLCTDGGDYYKLELDEFTLVEGQEVPVTSPFRYIRHWLGHQRAGTFESMTMKMKVNVSQKGIYGISFHGNFTIDHKYWWSDMQVWFTMKGTRVLFHNWSEADVFENPYRYQGLYFLYDVKLFESLDSAVVEYERVKGEDDYYEAMFSGSNDGFDWEDPEVAHVELPSLSPLPYQENIAGTVTHISLDRQSLWFYPSRFQSHLDLLLDKMDKLSIRLIPLSKSQILPGQLCAAWFSEDDKLYRAKVIQHVDRTVEVIFIDYGNTEIKNVDELYQLSEELSRAPAAVVNVKTNHIHVTMEKRMIGEEVVLRLEGWGGTETKGSARFFIGSEEVGVTPVKIAVETLPVGVSIEVVVVHVETVSEVWVTPVHKVEGVEACVDMVDKIAEILADQEQLSWLIPIETLHPGQVGLAKFSEDGLLYRCRAEEEGMVQFLDFGNREKNSVPKFKMPQEVEGFPAGAFRINLDVESTVENTTENMALVEKELYSENIFLIHAIGGVGTFYKANEPIQMF